MLIIENIKRQEAVSKAQKIWRSHNDCVQQHERIKIELIVTQAFDKMKITARQLTLTAFMKPTTMVRTTMGVLKNISDLCCCFLISM